MTHVLPMPGVDWLLDCEPRAVQLEALARSYTGFAYADGKDQKRVKRALPHAGKPARGWGHFMEMRLGKTPTLLNEFLLFERDYGINKAFILSPNKYKRAWEKEARKFGVTCPIHVFESKRKKDFVKFLEQAKHGIVVVNYEALSSEDNRVLFEAWVDDRTYMGADESVMMKNPQSGFFKHGYALSKKAALTRPMTGLPTPQSVADLFGQLKFARQLDGANFYSFRNRFAKMGGFQNKKVIGTRNQHILDQKLNDSVFGARRIDWGFYIASDYDPRAVPLHPKQQLVYAQMEKEFVALLDDGTEISVDQVISKHVKLQQISSGFILDEYGYAREIVPFNKTPKFIEMADLLLNEVSGKTITMVHFVKSADFLYEELTKLGLNPAIIRGDQHMRKMGLDTEEEKRKFNEDENCRVMIGQSAAIKYGHTLMGTASSPCLTTMYFENSYSLDNRSQSEQRNQGEGQLEGIHVIDFYGSVIEHRTIKALQRKEKVADVIMDYYKRGGDYQR